LPDIFEEIARIKRERLSAALATVVSGETGVPGKTGFRMLVYPDGEILGTVGGGLLEAKVRQEALRCMKEKTSRLLKLELDQTASGIGVLCGGRLRSSWNPFCPSHVYSFSGEVTLPYR
jgi:xanthine dehydrogenase accessory factor